MFPCLPLVAIFSDLWRFGWILLGPARMAFDTRLHDSCYYFQIPDDESCVIPFVSSVTKYEQTSADLRHFHISTMDAVCSGKLHNPLSLYKALFVPGSKHWHGLYRGRFRASPCHELSLQSYQIALFYIFSTPSNQIEVEHARRDINRTQKKPASGM